MLTKWACASESEMVRMVWGEGIGREKGEGGRGEREEGREVEKEKEETGK